MSMPSNPAFASLATYSDNPASAPAMQPTQSSMFSPHLGGNVPARDDIGDSEAATRFQDAERLAQHLVLIGRQVNHAIGNDDID